MEASDINQFMGEEARVVELGGLLERAGRQGRTQWRDLLDSPGIYAVCLTGWRTCSFSSDAGMAKHANPASPKSLCDKRDRILTFGQTDILYIGKAGGKTGSLRKRVSQLVRFGVGKAKNHRGGEWLWQLQEMHRSGCGVAPETSLSGLNANYSNGSRPITAIGLLQIEGPEKRFAILIVLYRVIGVMVLSRNGSTRRPGAKAVAMIGNVKGRFGMENQHIVSVGRGNLPACAGKKFGVFQDLQVIVPTHPANGFGTGNKVILNLVDYHGFAEHPAQRGFGFCRRGNRDVLKAVYDIKRKINTPATEYVDVVMFFHLGNQASKFLATAEYEVIIQQQEIPCPDSIQRCIPASRDAGIVGHDEIFYPVQL